MKWTATPSDPVRARADLLIAPVLAGESGPDDAHLKGVRKAAPQGAAALRRGKVFTGKPETHVLLPGERLGAAWWLLVGLGARDELTPDRVRRAAGVAARQARGAGARTCTVVLPPAERLGFDATSLARTFVEGAEMALSASGELKKGARRGRTESEPNLAWRLLVAGGGGAATRRGLAEGQAYAAGCLLARRLANLPANFLTPRLLAAEARRLARREGLRCRVLGPAALRREKMGGLLGVARGSREEPRLVVLEYPARGARRDAPLVALVGKGITFDAGGISIKPAGKMDEMRADMSGAAAVLGAALTVARLAMPVRLLAVIPAAENLPDGDAVKPGDVLTMASGKTVEVLNTDAEGRLILADALHFACRRRPDYLVDIATLTGACANALGYNFAGSMGTSAELIDVVSQAGGETFERVWNLPLVEEHSKAMEGDTADLKNIGPREEGAQTAAAFLAAFVAGNIPWIHLDIAGPAIRETATTLWPKGGTGFGARLLARTVEILVS
jgi:leucyl aminopeptidase